MNRWWEVMGLKLLFGFCGLRLADCGRKGRIMWMGVGARYFRVVSDHGYYSSVWKVFDEFRLRLDVFEVGKDIPWSISLVIKILIGGTHVYTYQQH